MQRKVRTLGEALEGTPGMIRLVNLYRNARSRVKGARDPKRTDRGKAEYRPKMSVIMPVYNTPIEHLESAIRSVQKQRYENWELCICDDGSPKPEVRRCLESWQRQEGRIMVAYSSRNEGISGASNRALQLASGEFVGMLDHDDELSPNALYEAVKALEEHPEADMLYSDEDKLDSRGQRVEPFFKPDWSPEYLLSCMYTCHFGVYRKTLVDEIGGFRAGFDGSQDYDLVLRLSERTERIYHIPKILYHWRMTASSVATSTKAKPYAYVAGARALSEHLERRQIPGEVVDGVRPGHYRIKFKLPGTEKVSIIVVASGRPDALRACISGIRAKTSYANYEVVVAGELDADTRGYLSAGSHKIVPVAGPFHFSRMVNAGAKHAGGSHLLVVRNDVEVIAADWMTAMLGFCRLEEIGVVGANLVYRNGDMQQRGVLPGLRNVTGRLFPKLARSNWRELNASSDTRNCAAVSGACMMVRKSVFEQVGGFDEELSSAYNDLDFCLKVREAGYRIVWTPWAELYHEKFEVQEGRRNSREVRRVKERWKSWKV